MCYYSINESIRGTINMNKDENHFWNLLEEESSTLYVDSDGCYIEEEETEETHTFDFGPEQLVLMFATKMGIEAEAA
jgi:hypothetical protein|tara:strand:- start:367 stop:597 length:231 start_codon:yes stop_codon:yes gene_type:complete